jgi:nicotinate-nucleotide pyrophosphorylase (carboxylating)
MSRTRSNSARNKRFLAGSIRQTPFDAHTRTLIHLALKEDIGKAGDLTTRCFLPTRLRLRGRIIAKQAGVICGLEIAREVFRRVSPRIQFTPLARDGALVRRGQAVARVSGPREILTAERTALNFLQRLSGIATRTRDFAKRLKGTRAKLYDTRKTLPGWRRLDKYAVRCGGGFNHRMGLYDMVMLKDNHLAAAKDLPRAVRLFRAGHKKIPVLIEAKTLAQTKLAVACGADIVLLDNMLLSALRRSIRFIRAKSPKALIEVSGGIRLDNIRSITRRGPDRISVGAITHSAPALDLSLELDDA